MNVSEGRRPEVVAALAAACGSALLDVHTDPDHHRSVFTLAESAGEVTEAALALARVAVERIDLSDHVGVHPRLGAVDVVPFVPLDECTPPPPPPEESVATTWSSGQAGPGSALASGGGARPRGAGSLGPGLVTAGEVARAWAEQAAAELRVPAFLYGAADPAGRALPDVRRTAFRERTPDFGPSEPHRTAGAMAVGARPVLVAINCELAAGASGLEADLAVARAVARRVRERDGGLAGVRALGFVLGSKGRAQVSMNLTDLGATGVEAACEAVRRAAAAEGGEVTAVELVGLLPAAELERCSGDFLAWSGLSADRTIEARLADRSV